MTTTGLLPPMGAAVKVYLVQGPPFVGGVALAFPCVELVASTDGSVGADGSGITSGIVAEVGVFSPIEVVDTVTS